MIEDSFRIFDAFSEQYKYDAISRALSPHSCPKRIDDMFPNQDGKLLLSQLIVGTLLNIYEITLRQYDKCTFNRLVIDIEKWAQTLEIKYGYDIDAGILGKYIIMDVLQNGGKPFSVNCIWDDALNRKELVFRLLDERDGGYTLTDVAFDYIYKKRDIETSVERYNISLIKMKMRLEKQDFSSATKNAEDLLIDIRQAIVNVNRFAQNCREGMTELGDKSDHSIFTQTIEIMQDVRNQVKEMRDKNNREQDILLTASASLSENKKLDANILLKDRERRLFKAKCDEIIDADDDLLLALKNAEKQYDNAILGMLNVKTYAYFDIKEDVLKPMLTKGADVLEDAMAYLFAPVLPPSRPEIYDMMALYEFSTLAQDTEPDEGVEIERDYEWEEIEKERIKGINTRYANITASFFAFARDKKRFRVSDYIASLRREEVIDYQQERSLANVLMKFFSMGSLDVVAYKEAREKYNFSVEANGQLNIDWCLEQMDEQLLEIKKLSFYRLDDGKECSYEAWRDGEKTRVYMTDYEVEVLS